MSDIREITADQFLEAVHVRSPLADVIYQELEFYSALGGWYLGVILRDKIDQDYSWVVLGPDESGTYRGIDQGWNVETEDESRQQLIDALKRFGGAGEQVNPYAV